jgi:hypothetical protein
MASQPGLISRLFDVFTSLDNDQQKKVVDIGGDALKSFARFMRAPSRPVTLRRVPKLGDKVKHIASGDLGTVTAPTASYRQEGKDGEVFVTWSDGAGWYATRTMDVVDDEVSQ